MPLIDELLDVIRTGDMDVGNYTLVMHPEDYHRLVASMNSPSLIRGVERDAYIFGFQLRMDSSVPPGQVTVVRHDSPVGIRNPFPRISEYVGEFQRPSDNFFNIPYQGLSTFRQPNEQPEAPPPAPKTLWDHLESDVWDDE